LTFGNGITETRNWNNLFEQTSIQAGNLLTLGYNYCNNGTSQCTSGNTGSPFQHTISPSGTVQAVQEFQHDALNRIQVASEHPGSSTFSLTCPDSGSTWCQQFSYDRSGNRTIPAQTSSIGAPVWSAGSFNSKNQVADLGWVYDNAGNVIQSPAGQTMTYDGEGRMASFCGATSAGVCTQLTQFAYDAAGNRVQRTDSTPTTTTTTTFVYDAFGNLAADYGAPATPAGTQYVTVDALGSTRLVMSGTQATERHDFRPYGDEIEPSEVASGLTAWRPAVPGYGVDAVRQKFTGKERDAETGLDYFGARYFSGAQGRFASVDPSNAGADPSDPQSWNGYAYVGNNPQAFVDPSGMNRQDGTGTSCGGWGGIPIGGGGGSGSGGLPPLGGSSPSWPLPSSPIPGGPFGAGWQASGSGTTLPNGPNGPIIVAAALVNAKQAGKKALTTVGKALEKGSDWLNTAPGIGLAMGLGVLIETGGQDETPAVAEAEEALEATLLKGTNLIRFSQDSISQKFKDGRALQETIDALRSGKLTPGELQAARIFVKDGITYTLDNRRLMAAHIAGVPLRVRMATAAELARELGLKFGPINDGRMITISGLPGAGIK
jgi:RHS repeat-associated protein